MSTIKFMLPGLATLAFVVSASGQSAPVVSNVRATQRTDNSRMVDVYYSLTTSTPCTVWVAMSDDGGQTWGVPVRTLTGAFGNGISAGQDKLITWDAAADIPGVLGTFRARVYADDGSAQGDMVFVAAGTYAYQNGGPLYVASFWIDKYEVTNQRYAEFLNAADFNGDHWISSMEITRTGTAPDAYYAVQPGRQNYPIRMVSAVDAEAYAAWLSAREHRNYRLPTDQEWEKAAAWDPIINKHWLYGFQNDQIDCSVANYNDCIGQPTEVGHYRDTNLPNSFYGCYDMSGNVWEWTTSIGASPNYRVVRGGDWGDDATVCQTTNRSNSYPYGQGYRWDNIGFRLVLDPN